MRIVLAAHFLKDGDDEEQMDAVAAALASLKQPGTTGAAAAYDLDDPANVGIVEDLRAIGLKDLSSSPHDAGR